MARPIPHHIRVVRALDKIGETRDIRALARAANLSPRQTSRALQVAKGKRLVRRVTLQGAAVTGNWIPTRPRNTAGYPKVETGRLSNLGRIMGDGYGTTRH